MLLMDEYKHFKRKINEPIEEAFSRWDDLVARMLKEDLSLGNYNGQAHNWKEQMYQ